MKKLWYRIDFGYVGATTIDYVEVEDDNKAYDTAYVVAHETANEQIEISIHESEDEAYSAGSW